MLKINTNDHELNINYHKLFYLRQKWRKRRRMRARQRNSPDGAEKFSGRSGENLRTAQKAGREPRRGAGLGRTSMWWTGMGCESKNVALRARWKWWRRACTGESACADTRRCARRTAAVSGCWISIWKSWDARRGWYGTAKQGKSYFNFKHEWPRIIINYMGNYMGIIC